MVPFAEDCLETVAKWLSTTECEVLLRGSSSSLVRSSQYLALEGEGRRAALVIDRRGTIVGLAHFWRLGEGVYEIGGATGDQRLWGTGIGIEAGMLLVDYLFEVLNCRRVEFTTGAHNDSTVKLGLADGLTFEAVCLNYFQTPDGPAPGVKSSLTREEYYRPYPHYQPRVGRRVDEDLLSRLTGTLVRGIDRSGSEIARAENSHE
ncbi:GNAT family N-acetyltransferase [Nonomuraea candida]|uniref:GNAT family N-acetyltransferase n=1 Tax=Nonomuraea candida TaxID=359159 RepID=UPI0006936EBE|nr:GNAT family protein [Nonomuraea candida]